jgi:hypothetical protein
MVTTKDALRIVRFGRGRWKKLKVNGQLKDLDNEVVMFGGEWRQPRTISADDIESAYVQDSKYSRVRIEEFDQGKRRRQMDALVERAKQTLDQAHCSQAVFAFLVGRHEAVISRILSGLMPLTPELRLSIAKALTFIIMMQENSAAPICFHEVSRIEKLWAGFQANFDDTNGDARASARAVSEVAR